MSKPTKRKINKGLVQRVNLLDNTIFYVLLFFMAFVPLLVRLHPVQHAGPLISLSILDSGTKYDISTFYKLVFLLFGAAIALILYLVKLQKENFRIVHHHNNIPLAALYCFVLFSGIFAEYKTLSLVGQFNQHMGTLAFLSYLVLFFVASQIHYPEKKLNWLLFALYPLIIINAILSLLYFFGFDPLDSSIVLAIILPSNFSPSGLQTGSYLNSTLSNPDFLSGIASVLTVLFLSRAVLISDIKSRGINLLFATLSLAMMLVSLATSGFFTFVVSLPLVILIAFRSEQRKQAMATLAMFVIVFTLVFIPFNLHNPQVWNSSLGFFLGEHAAPQAISPSHASSSSQYNDGPIVAADSDPEFNLPPQKWAPGTGRLYIWKKTLGLIKAHPVLGYGLDTIAYYFPQDDPEKNSGLNNPDTVVDKPHNMYLALAFGSGVLVLLAFLVLLSFHLWNNIKLLKKPLEGERRVFLASLFAAWFAYLVQGLFNDSIIGTAVVFWVLFGVSVSVLQEELAD